MGLNSSFGEVNLDALDATIADNAVDIFIYDTSKDSDGGKWRKRTKKTSWYNETLNTATRGSRREFPAVAVIVATSSKVIIYDGDDPDMPMWMEFISTAGQYGALYDGRSVKSVVAKNGEINVADSVDSVYRWSFITDTIKSESSSGRWNSHRNIAGRNPSDSTNLWNNYNSTTTLVAYPLNDLAVTVLPNAPIDSATGLPVPTIIVCTGTTPGGAASIIKDDRTVSNITNNIFGSGYQFSSSVFDNGEYFTACSSGDYTRVGIANVSTATHKYFITSPNIPGSYKVNLGYARKSSSLDEGLAIGGIYGANLYRESGLCLIKPDMNNFSAGTMHSHITSTYNTGYQVGDIKGAFLSDTDATNVTDANLITNGTFDSNTSGWTAYNAVISVDTNRLKIDDSAGVGSWSSAVQEIPTQIGKQYILQFTYTVSSDSLFAGYYAGSYASVGAGTAPTASTNYGSSGTYSIYITATTSITSIILVVNNNGISFVDNVSFKLNESDRSVNNKGLQVFGTITKSAVATGADLVAYSGFSNSTNYLSQPSNSDLAIGNSDFSCVGWFKKSTSSNTGMIIFASNGSNQTFDVRVHTDRKMLAQITDDTFSTREIVNGQGPTVNDNIWHQFHVVRRSNVLYSYLDGNLLGTSASVEANITNPMGITIGAERLSGNQKAFEGSLSLIRFSKSAPSPEKIKKIYEDEKVLFQENAACTLYGSSDVVTALAYDDKTNLLHVGTSSGRSDFRKLRRINNTTTGITTAISASNKLIAEQ